MLQELGDGRLADCRRVLFIHTGGIFSLFGRSGELLGAD
jgi:1-aminocyclopropane-1-carboxylate deaminase/D-cysteine desulfhydrase-like pyridoxal-dependent ACC family enzyme